MKKTIFIVLVFLIGANSTAAYNNYGSGFRMFYTSLQPYGEWIEIDYDLYAWRPYDVRYSWRPYSDGRWEWTRHGWYWVSYEPFGWATYHYGRWFHDDYYGWLWLPDTEWGPSWVEWRYNSSYIGWAPLPPYARFSVHGGIRFSVSWHSGYYHWSFVKYRNFNNRNIHVHIVDNYRTYKIYNKTKYRTNYYERDGRIINGGISRNYVERKGGYRIKERHIENTSDVKNYRTRSNDSSRDRVISYKPRVSERDFNRTIDRSDIVRGKVKSGIKKDRISIDRTESKKRNVEITDRTYYGRKGNVKKSESRSVTKKSPEKREITYRKDNSNRHRDISKNSVYIEPKKIKKEKVRKSTERKSEKRTVKSETRNKSNKEKLKRAVKKDEDTSSRKRSVKNENNRMVKKRLNP